MFAKRGNDGRQSTSYTDGTVIQHRVSQGNTSNMIQAPQGSHKYEHFKNTSSAASIGDEWQKEMQRINPGYSISVDPNLEENTKANAGGVGGGGPRRSGGSHNMLGLTNQDSKRRSLKRYQSNMSYVSLFCVCLCLCVCVCVYVCMCVCLLVCVCVFCETWK